MTLYRIVAPVSGVFYQRPSPGEPPFKAVGEAVSVGETVGLIEVMKTFFPLEAETAGRLVRFVAKDNVEIETGDPLVELEC